MILGDGYTAAELPQYRADAQAFVNAFSAREPFLGYGSYFNVHRVDVVSNGSGADHPEQNIVRDTRPGEKVFDSLIESVLQALRSDRQQTHVRHTN